VQCEDTENRRWKREETAAHLVAFEAAASQGTSQRSFASQHEVPRTTLQYWLERRHSLDASATVVAFFESPEGLAFLHRLVIAIQFVMCFVGGCGLRLVATVLRLAGLSPFVANSFGSRQRLGADMETEIRAFGEEQRARLAPQMPSKRISVCEDETFHPETCLIAIEPVSNFILLEKYADGRDAATWTAALGEQLAGLPVQVIQSTSDEAKGLLGHVRTGLGAHHSPDIFHVQQELSRGTSVVLAAHVRQADQAAAEAAAQTEAVRREAEAWAQSKHGPGRPPDFEGRLTRARATQAQAEQASQTARARQERVHQAIRGIGEAYHPVDLATGTPRTPAEVTAVLEPHFDQIATAATEAALPERCHKGIHKARRLLPALACTLAFFHREAGANIEALGLTSQQTLVVQQRLVPAAYLERVARKAPSADTRIRLQETAARLRGECGPALATLSPDRRRGVDDVIRDCADLFQRSSSCVEGRNGQLSLHHHGLHCITPTRLQALTTVHNYFIRRPDGSTAASRFFGRNPADLFDWLLDRLDLPARPAARRRRPAAPTLLN
jgi:hypothetical protein